MFAWKSEIVEKCLLVESEILGFGIEFSLRESGITLTIGIYKESIIHCWEFGNHTVSLCSKRFRLVSKKRKFEERDFRYTCAIFRTVFDSRSSFFTPKLHENASYAGFHTAESRIQDCLGLQGTLHGRNITPWHVYCLYERPLQEILGKTQHDHRL